MNDFDRAAERMRRVIDACDELISMAEKDVANLKKRKRKAQHIIDMAERLRKIDHSGERNEMVLRLASESAAELADRDLAMVSCMGVGIRVEKVEIERVGG